MKKLFFCALVAMFAFASCGVMLKAPVASVKSNLYKYNYVYVVPTSGVTSSSGVYGGQYGVYGGQTKTINPSETISGYLMKIGFTPVPSVTEELADKTLVVSYGYTGRRQLGLLAYASCIIIQMRDAKTHQMVASCESEGCGSDETDDILQAIHSGLNTIFAR
jgi:hypothetical protein